MSTGNKLLQLIKKKGIKQIDLARYLDISPSQLTNYLNDKHDMDLQMLAEAANYLSADLNYFADISFTELRSWVYDIEEELIVSGNLVTVKVRNIDLKPTKRVVTLDRSLVNVSSSGVIFYVNVNNPYFIRGSHIICSYSPHAKKGALLLKPGADIQLFQLIEGKPERDYYEMQYIIKPTALASSIFI